MYKIVIADDEVIECKSLRALINKEFNDVEVVGVANNGVELVALVQDYNPDIAIVDVNMPGINGIDAIDLLRSRGLNTKFIINSAYNEFEYVQKALLLDVDAYILKPQKRELIVNTIRKTCADIDEMNLIDERQKQIQDVFKNVKPVLENEIMFSIFKRQPDIKSFLTYCDMSSMQFRRGTIVYIIPNSESINGLSRIDKNSLYQFIKSSIQDSSSLIVNISDNGICIFAFTAIEDYKHTCSWLDDILNIIIFELEKEYNIAFRLGVGDWYDDFNKMFNAYSESLRALKSQDRSRVNYYQKHMDLQPKDIAVLSIDGDGRESEKKEYKIDALKKIDISDSALNIHIKEALSYIEDNYKFDISLDTISEAIDISPFYLSRLFKQEIGQTYVEYITNVRIQYAIELINNTKLTIHDIAKLTGFNNDTYFCRVFKRCTGCTVGKFRDKNLK